MFVFTRRAMQQMLDDIAPWMPERALRDLLGRLNEARTNRLPQMWELAWLYALGAVLPVEHEHALPNGKPDLWFSVSDGERLVPVVADITTLSDAALHKANPFERLIEAVHQQASKVGIQRGGFHVAVSNLEPGKSGAKKVQLLIPNGSAFEQINRRFIAPFVGRVAANPSTLDTLEVDEPGAKFTIEYKGLSQNSSGSYRSYDSVLSLGNNVLSNRLAAKTHQLRGAPAGAVRMLVVCDGDCALLRRDRPQEGFSAQQISEHFLRGSQTIDLVLLATVSEKRASNFAQRGHRYLHCGLVAAPSDRPAHLTPGVVEAVRRVFEDAVKKLPDPQMMPNNALRRNLDSEWSESMEGGYTADGERIRVSARAVLELLAGVMSYEQFTDIHGWTEGRFNMFKSRLASGQLFRSARIECSESGEDDDWLDFEFGPPDPAISPFRLPRC